MNIPDLVREAVGSEAEFGLLITIDMPETHHETFLSIAQRAEQGTHAEPGNLAYTFLAAPHEPGTCILNERWKNVAALEAHFDQPYTAELLSFLGDHDAVRSVQVLAPLF